MFYNTMGGVLQTPQIYMDVARNAGANRFQTFRRIAFPAALPSIFTGLKLAAGSSYIIIAAAEFLGARRQAVILVGLAARVQIGQREGASRVHASTL